jgi:hypothetical protein
MWSFNGGPDTCRATVISEPAGRDWSRVGIFLAGASSLIGTGVWAAWLVTAAL